MYRLNYKMNDTIESKFFNTIEEAYWYAVDNFATKEDREWYQDICGETFKSVVEKETGGKTDLMCAIMRNSMEKIVFFDED